jgi:hypothetical protein
MKQSISKAHLLNGTLYGSDEDADGKHLNTRIQAMGHKLLAISEIRACAEVTPVQFEKDSK